MRSGSRTLPGVPSPGAVRTQYLSACPPPSRDLAVAYRREAEAVGVVTLREEAHRLAAQWLDPVLACTARPGIPRGSGGGSDQDRRLASVV